ncbi:Transferrin-binding protein 2 precursor, partial [Haemophilus influenzae]
GGGPYWLN